MGGSDGVFFVNAASRTSPGLWVRVCLLMVLLALSASAQDLVVVVIGSVVRSGRYQVPAGARAWDAIQKAGGWRSLLPENLALRPAFPAESERLQAGDIITVPRGLEIRVRGAVSQPGTYVLPRSACSVQAALSRSGGPMERTQLLACYRSDAARAESIEVPPSRWDSTSLQDGDFLFFRPATVSLRWLNDGQQVWLKSDMTLTDLVQRARLRAPTGVRVIHPNGRASDYPWPPPAVPLESGDRVRVQGQECLVIGPGPDRRRREFGQGQTLQDLALPWGQSTEVLLHHVDGSTVGVRPSDPSPPLQTGDVIYLRQPGDPAIPSRWVWIPRVLFGRERVEVVQTRWPDLDDWAEPGD